MDFATDPVHDQIRHAVRKVCSQFPDDYWMHRDEDHEFPWEFYTAIVRGGWLGLTIPEEYGGGGLGVTEAAIVEQEIAASGAGMNGCTTVHIGIFGFESIIEHGTEELKRRFLPRAASGDLHVSFAVTEPDAGTDTTRISTSARKVDGGYLVSGKKVWISRAQEAERMFLLARTTPIGEVQKKTAGMTLFFAPVDREKVGIRPIAKMGRNAVDTNELFIEDLFVPDEDVIGEVGQGFKAILAGLNAERVISGNAAVGIGRAALRRATEYAKQRVVFGRPIGQNQGVQFPIARAYVELQAAAMMVEAAAHLFEDGEPCGTEANMAKLLASEASWRAADMCVQTHGGFGFAEEFDIERKFRETRLYQVAPISTNLILSHVGTHVLGLPRSY